MMATSGKIIVEKVRAVIFVIIRIIIIVTVVIIVR